MIRCVTVCALRAISLARDLIMAVDAVGRTITLASPEGSDTEVAATPDIGAIVIPFAEYSAGISPRVHFPQMVRARIVGDQVGVRAWPAGGIEPAAFQVVDLSAETHLPVDGKVAYMCNHLYGEGRYEQFGPIEITPLATL